MQLLDDKYFQGYKYLNIKEKARMLVDINEVEDIVEAMKKQEANSKNKAIPPDPQLFKAIHHRIYKILKQNYLPDFYSKVLQIPTKIYRDQTSYVGLRFNSCGDDIVDSG